MTAPLLQAEGLRAERGGRWVIDGIDLQVPAGQWTAVVGPNGAGKSSLLAALAGLLPHQGRVRLQGRDRDAWPPRERAQRLAWLSQQSEAEGEIAVRDVVRLGRLPRHGLFGAPDAADEAAVDAALAETTTAPFAARRLSALSGGERQRVLLARALAVGAPLWLLDEPTTHLDAPHQRDLLATLRRHTAAGGAALVVLHDLNLALAADRLLLLVAGRAVAEGAPGDAALHAALAAAFDHAIDTVALPAAQPGGAPRWLAVPRLP